MKRWDWVCLDKRIDKGIYYSRSEKTWGLFDNIVRVKERVCRFHQCSLILKKLLHRGMIRYQRRRIMIGVLRWFRGQQNAEVEPVASPEKRIALFRITRKAGCLVLEYSTDGEEWRRANSAVNFLNQVFPQHVHAIRWNRRDSRMVSIYCHKKDRISIEPDKKYSFCFMDRDGVSIVFEVLEGARNNVLSRWIRQCNSSIETFTA